MKKKEKKEKKPLTKKRILFLTVMTIVLGILAYFLGTVIAKAVLDYQNKDQEVDFSDLIEVDTIEDMTLENLLTRYNELLEEHGLSSYHIDQEALRDTEQGKSITVSDVEFVFQTEGDDVEISAINYKEETEETKELAMLLMLANQENMSEEDASLLYDKIIETRENTEEDGNYTSEFFQYLGIEVSLKTWSDQEYPYQIRIGRITR